MSKKLGVEGGFRNVRLLLVVFFLATPVFSQQTTLQPTTIQRDYPWAEERWGITPIKFRSLPLEQLRSMGYTLQSDWPDMTTVGTRLRLLLSKRDFVLLDRALSDLDRVLKCDNGEWVSGLPMNLYWMNEFVDQPDLALIEQWKVANPTSIYASYIEASYWFRSAWHIRGGGYSSQVSPEQMVMFDERLNRANEIINARQNITRKSALFSLLELSVLSVASSGQKPMMMAFEKARSKWPAYVPIYRVVSAVLLPRWGGSLESFHKFTKDHASIAFSTNDDSSLARLYGEYEDAQVFDSVAKYWSEIKPSFESWVQKSTGADRERAFHRFKHFACGVRDADAIAFVHGTMVREKLLGSRYVAADDACLRQIVKPS
jgi:Domain of unknown function (DUF4034)